MTKLPSSWIAQGMFAGFIFLIGASITLVSGGSSAGIFMSAVAAVIGWQYTPELLTAITQIRTRLEQHRTIVSPQQDVLPASSEMLQDVLPSQQESVQEAAFFLPPLSSLTQKKGPVLHLSDEYQPDVQSFLGEAMLYLGVRGSGKSNALAVTAEEEAKHGVPLLIADTKGEYAGLVDPRFLRHGVLVASQRWLDAAETTSTACYALNTPEEARAFGRALLDALLQVVLILPSYTNEEAAWILTEIISGMNEWEAERPNKERVPCSLYLDEAHKWLPQNAAYSAVSREAQTALDMAFFDTVVSLGRSYGFGPRFATQRPSKLNKNVLMSEGKFLFRQSEKIELDYYRELGLNPEAVRLLQPGECFVFSSHVEGKRVRLRQRVSPHLAITPGLAQLMSYQQHAIPVQAALARGTTRVLTASLEKAEEPSQRLSPKQVKALELYQAGNTSVRALAAALTEAGMPTDANAAYHMMCVLDAKKLITRAKRTSI